MINAGAIACVTKGDVSRCSRSNKLKRKWDTHLNRTQHGKEHVLERTVRQKRRQRDDHERRVQQCALERHRHVPEVKRALVRPDRPYDRLPVHPESGRDEAGRADVHRCGKGPVIDAGDLDGVGAVDCAGRGADDEPGDGGAKGGEIEQRGERQRIHASHADDMASIKLNRGFSIACQREHGH